MGFAYGWGTLVCQECRGAKKIRESKRCKPCNYKSKECEEIQRESQKKRFEDPEERRKTADAVRKSPVFQEMMKSKEYRETLRRVMKKRFEDPEERRKTGEAVRKHFEDHKERRKLREATRNGLKGRKAMRKP